ncbi:MAG: Uncharacterized protein G01um101493_10 [Microgenomates group bacterium Gr01-1014_93]|nr:MAG: Uncharacterized protein G01um101493_10 [Microgenomates group bacterium Gr01-1014_93]
MKLKFPYESKPTLNFGNIPTIKLKIEVETPQGFIPLLFLFDTGADVTSLPISSAGKLGINLDKCPKEPMSGYEGGNVEVYLSKLNVKFNKQTFTIPCVFSPNENVPILLGRAGIITRFNIKLDAKNKEITFEEI